MYKEQFFFINKNTAISLVIGLLFVSVMFSYNTAESNSLEELGGTTTTTLVLEDSQQEPQPAPIIENKEKQQVEKQQVEKQQVEKHQSNVEEDTLRELLFQMESVVKRMNGEGMITLVEEDMLDILSKNENLAKENERLVNELAKAKDLLAKQLQREQEILAIADKLMLLNSDSKTQEQQIKDIPSPSKAIVSGSGAIEGISTDGKTKLPFSIISLAEDYIVVEKLGGGYDSVEVGESVRGQVLLNIDMMKKILTTDKGEFELRKIEEKIKPVKPTLKPVKQDQPLIPKLEQKASTKVAVKEKLKTFPYKVLGMGSGFIVVDQGQGDFRTVKEGESLEFIDKNVKATKLTLLKVNTSKSSIETDLGSFIFSFEKAKE